MNVWLECIRKKIRFNYKGLISAEDLFDLSVSDLQGIYRMYAKEYNDLTQYQLDDSIDEGATDVLIQRDIVREVYTVKLAEKMARQNAQAKEETRQEILSIMAEKQKDDLKNLSMEELQAKLDNL